MTYLLLFYEFFKIGLFAIGGGMATIPFLIDLANKYDWYTVEEFGDMVAISQSTPGPVGVNMATYAGYNAGGILGAIVATVALTLPALFIIFIIAKFMQNFSDNKFVKSAFEGIRPAVAALILFAVFQLCEISLFKGELSIFEGKINPNYTCIIVVVVFFLLMQIKKIKDIHPLFWIIAGAIVGIIFKM